MGPNATALGAFIAASQARELPPEITNAAKLCLADWMSVALGAALGPAGEPAGKIVREVARGWHGEGRAALLLGGRTAAPMAALVNGTLAHCLDFDDTYVDSITHISAPVWAATLALGTEVGASEQDLLRAFVTGFEVVARVGHGLGQHLTSRGWHGTGVFGRIGAAAAGAAVLGLDAERAVNAIALGATQAGGFVASFGTMAKPFHAGKAAMDGVIAAQLAAAGLTGAAGLFEPGGGMDNALVQDGAAGFSPVVFSDWRILRNSFKPYAACHLIHPAIDAARVFWAEGGAPGAGTKINAAVGALAKQVTGETDGNPGGALAGKFDLRYCVALALHGHDLSAVDFREPWSVAPAIAALAKQVIVTATPEMGFASAALEIGDRRVHVKVAKGHPGNPMGWDDMRMKFDGLVTDGLGNRAPALFAALRDFGGGASLPVIHDIAA